MENVLAFPPFMKNMRLWKAITQESLIFSRLCYVYTVFHKLFPFFLHCFSHDFATTNHCVAAAESPLLRSFAEFCIFSIPPITVTTKFLNHSSHL